MASLGIAVEDKTSLSSRPESLLQLVRPVASVENKNVKVMSENVPADKLFPSCPLYLLGLPAVYN